MPPRQTLAPDVYASAAGAALGVSLEAIAGPRSGRELTRKREIFAFVGVETFAVRVKDMARQLGKNPGVVSRWANFGAERCAHDDAFRERVEQLRADVRASTTGTAAGESDFVTGVEVSFVD